MTAGSLKQSCTANGKNMPNLFYSSGKMFFILMLHKIMIEKLALVAELPIVK